MSYDLLVVGGGAAGVFSALAAKEAQPCERIHILEISDRLLEKVRLSGGGRCNITNSCLPLSAFVQNYPRGSKELLGPLHRFGPQETVEWFESHGVPLKTEADGRIFPVTNSSQTVVSCLSSELSARGVDVSFRAHIRSLARAESHFEISFDDGPPLTARAVVLATGSSPSGYALAASLGHTLVPSVPSLFALTALAPLPVSGVCVESVVVSFPEPRLSQRGSLLITHAGFSGPAALKLSSLGARYLHERGYKAELSVNWVPDMTEEALFQRLVSFQRTSVGCLDAHPFAGLPKSLWKILVLDCKNFHPYLGHLSSVALRSTTGNLLGLPVVSTLRHGAKSGPNKGGNFCNQALAGEGKAPPLSHKFLREVAHRLHDSRYAIDGLSPNREEFVACGGVRRSEICWKTMESIPCPGLFCVGELLDVDGLTGGFNLQNAWTTGWIAGRAFTSKA